MRTCARCSAPIRVDERHTYSRATKSYYCWNFADCSERRNRRKAAADPHAVGSARAGGTR